MNVHRLRAAVMVFALTAGLVHFIEVEAAKPTGGGGGQDSTATTAALAPAFNWVELDRFARVARLHGVNFFSVSLTFPDELTVGGRAVVIDQAASSDDVEDVLVVPFDSLLDALVSTTPGGRVLRGGRNFEIKVVTLDGTDSFSAYIASDIKDVPADTGSCPCSDLYVSFYKEDDAVGDVLCSSPVISSDEYVESGYQTAAPDAVIIGSHSSISEEPLYQSSCSVRGISQIINGVETPQYLGDGPIPIGNGDHLECVTAIQLLSSACPL